MIGSPARNLAAAFTLNRRRVLCTYPGLRMGNVLYFALRARLMDRPDRPYRVMDPEPDAGWHLRVPAITRYLIGSGELRFSDRRDHLVDTFFQEFGVDFSADDLSSFIRHTMLREVFPDTGIGHPGEVVINVRRGDYYTDPEVRRSLGFDVADYVGRALSELEARTGPAERILVVSDGIKWCRENLSFLGQGRQVWFNDPADDAWSNFCDVARGHRLILTNSTFSYWAGYVSNVARSNHDAVWVPTLHSRAQRGGMAWQHDPRWNRIDVS